MSDTPSQSPDQRYTTAEIVSPLLERRDPSAPERLATSVQHRFEEMRRNFAIRRGNQPTVLSFTGYGTTSWIRVLSRVVMAPDEAFENGRRLAKVVEDGVRGWRNFVSPPVPYAEVEVHVGEQTFTVRADRGGVVDARVEVAMEPGWQTIQLAAADGEVSTSDIFIVRDDVTTGLVSDIDDTVVVTALPRPLLAAWNSFVLDEHARTPTPGMAVLLHRVLESSPGSPVIYLSTGAWNVAQTLSRFLSRNLYPFGPLLLTAWGPTEDRWFRSGMEHKVTQLERLAQDFPHMKWLLVGDDGQHDPEIYADFARRHPDKVRAIVIRQLTPSEALLAGGRASDTRDTTPGVPWCYGPDGAALAGQLEELGLVDPETASETPLTWPRGGKGDTSEGSVHAEQARG
ncbi:App1 family protein [Micrococcus terreus]|uniref:App1 family protein n=1 Tax=Micrococcus terreus TaxID=574650 RepID=UPI0023F844D8|nr:phosphatase domain-containing protein [Micrococcus terreus]